MNILAKRAVALLIDAFLFGIYYTVVAHFCLPYMEKLGSIAYVIFFIPFFLKDCAFKNASIGKKILGIRIYGADWNPIGAFELVKRTVIMQTVGYIKWLKIRIFGECSDILDFFDWERERLKTVVIDKKVFDQISQEADLLSGSHAENLTMLYNAYLRKIYAE